MIDDLQFLIHSIRKGLIKDLYSVVDAIEYIIDTEIKSKMERKEEKEKELENN